MPLRTRHGIPLPTPRATAPAPDPVPAGDAPPPLPDLEILVVVHGRSLPRAAAVARTFARWDATQAPMPRVLCAWCYRDGEAPGDLATLPDYPWLVCVPLPMYDLEDGVFRKEALLNLLLRDHATAPYLLTLDADVWTPERGWFAKVRDLLAADPRRVFQPWAIYRDTQERIPRRSWSARALPDSDPRGCLHPGLGWAFSLEWFLAHTPAPFNAWQICGAGDGVFVAEHFDDRSPDYLALSRLPACMRAFARHGLPRGVPACVDVEVWHDNHTDHAAVPPPWRGRTFADRGYTWARSTLDRWGDIRQYIRLDRAGVPRLSDPSGPFARALLRKAEMQTKERAERVIAECLGLAPAATVAAGQLPDGDPVVLETLDGLGDHLMLCGVVRAIHRARPAARVAVHLTRPGLEPWFREVCPSVEFTERHGRKLAWLWEGAPPGRHHVERYGTTPEDIRLDPPRVTPHAAPRIAFVGSHNPVLPLKTWPHWDRLAAMVRECYGVDPIRVGTDVLADPLSDLPALLASMDLVVCTEGAASHICWAIRRRAVVLLPGAIEASALAYPGWHTILQGACPQACRHCHHYTNGRTGNPACRAECMAGLRPETVLAAMDRPPRVVNVHFLSDNCGDANCGVARYFPGIEERGTDQPAVPCDVAIFGGGGVFQERVLRRARQYRDLGARIVVWGAGIVTEDRARGVTPATWREFGDLADICALREPSPWEFAPCPSCLSPLFDELRETAPVHEVVYYNHPDKPVRDGQPRMGNYDTTDLAAVLRFLASGRRVVTSSYHGRIWATWLGRDVELDGPAAPMLAQSGPVPPLAEARRLTRAMHTRVYSLPGLAHTHREDT